VTDRHGLGTATLRQRTATAVADPVLRRNVARAVDRFVAHRAVGIGELDDVEGLRSAARAVKLDVLDRLPELLEQFAERVEAAGGHVHWAPTAADATETVAGICRRHGARTVVKSKSMATEEIGLDDVLEAEGFDVVETDLGEWIIQLAQETPSHIIIPAVHRDRHAIADVFREVAGRTDRGTEPEDLNAFARERLRSAFLAADVGVTGVNFGVAQSGSIVLVTNEGNGRMTSTLPPVHVAVMGVERLVADWSQLDLLLNLLTRSSTGQRLTSYTNIVTGPRRTGEVDGPDELHVVLLDNGRSDLLGTELHEMLTCLRCGACLNVCPVYRQVGGHAYGWVYSGPMGAVLTPLLAAHRPGAAEVSSASTLCGACMDACPVQIPLQDLLLSLRRRRAEDAGRAEQVRWRAWATAWSSADRYDAATRVALGAARHLPLDRLAGLLPGARAWAGAGRTLPRPAVHRFRDRWAGDDW
jgi:L-lactate dehydrogenase complex protein LldF